MASSSSLTLLAPPNWKHHVFPSFHGADVRTNFLSHVLKEFRSKGIDSFIDNDIERSKLIGTALVEVIRGSRIAIVLLSKNYASSTWCLNELVDIMKCREEFGQTVMSIFYEVDPTDVKNQTGDFGKVFGKTCVGKTKEEIRRWKCALTEVAQIAGYHSTNWESEAEMIEDIATDVSNKLNLSAPCNDFDGLVGMESKMKKMRRLLQLDSDEVRKIGIWGPPGIDNIKRKYAIPASSNDYSVKLNLQKQLMSQLTNETRANISHLGVVKDRLKDKKVLVVLDDVDHLVQLEAMAKETYWFGPGSRIIITTQDQRVLKASGTNHIHKVNLPSHGEALQMFCMYAFDQKYPKDGFEELACEVMNLVGELPLGLRVMGSYFWGRCKHYWIEALPRLKTNLDRDGKIASIIRFSYDALNDEDKSLFLHIACFYDSEPLGMVERCLEKCFENVRQGLHVLYEKSLISMDPMWIEMPKLLVRLGRQIVRKESVSEPGKRQFLNDAINIGEILSDDKAGSSVIGINLKEDEDITWTSERVFEKMSNLQFLRIFGESVNPRSMNYMSRKLKVLIWPSFHMSCFPSSFNSEFLVELHMTKSSLEKLWEDTKPLRNLKWMDLSLSRSLKELPDLSTAINLYFLDLSYCSNLVELPSSIWNIFKLQYLNLSHCSSLVKLPSSIGNAINLRELNLSRCSSLVEIPFSIGKAINIEELDLSYCSSLVELPSSMKNLGKLSKLELSDCSKLEVNLANINVESLEELNLSGCYLLKIYPESSTEIQELDPWIGRISCLHRIVLGRLTNLVSLPQLPASLLELYAKNCESLERLDCCFHNPDILLSFKDCFKLNQEARHLIIQMPTKKYAVFPCVEVPICFTYRSSGSSVTVKLNQVPLGTSTKFKACIILAGGDDTYWGTVCCSITSGGNALTYCKKEVGQVVLGHLYTFEVEVETEEVTSTELVFDFDINYESSNYFKKWKIKECGIFQLLEVPLLNFRDVVEDCEPSDNERIGDRGEDYEPSDNEGFRDVDEDFEPSDKDI